MERIRKAHLEFCIKRVNQLAGTPDIAWTRIGNRNVASIGHIFLDRSYGGYQISQMMNEGGGQRHFGHSYRMTSRETWMCLQSIIEVLELKKVIQRPALPLPGATGHSINSTWRVKP